MFIFRNLNKLGKKKWEWSKSYVVFTVLDQLTHIP